jgi:hypothetical protein
MWESAKNSVSDKLHDQHVNQSNVYKFTCVVRIIKQMDLYLDIYVIGSNCCHHVSDCYG